MWRPCLLTDWDEMSNLYRGPCIDASYQVLVHLGKRFQRRFLKIDQSETELPVSARFVNGSGQNEQASYQVSVHVDKRFQSRRFFRNQLTRNKNCLWQPCLLTDQDEMSNLYRGPSIDASYQVSYHLAERFQRKSCFRNRPTRNKNYIWWQCL